MLARLYHYMMVMVGDMVNDVIGQWAADFLQIGSGLKYALCSCPNIAASQINGFIHLYHLHECDWVGHLSVWTDPP